MLCPSATRRLPKPSRPCKSSARRSSIGKSSGSSPLAAALPKGDAVIHGDCKLNNLLFEAGAEDRVDAGLMITVDEEEQLQRLVERDGLSMQDAQNRVDAQMPQAEKTPRSDFVIDSGGSLEELKERVMALFKSLTSA